MKMLIWSKDINAFLMVAIHRRNIGLPV